MEEGFSKIAQVLTAVPGEVEQLHVAFGFWMQGNNPLMGRDAHEAWAAPRALNH
jgi:hypothetical protein